MISNPIVEMAFRLAKPWYVKEIKMNQVRGKLILVSTIANAYGLKKVYNDFWGLPQGRSKRRLFGVAW